MPIKKTVKDSPQTATVNLWYQMLFISISIAFISKALYDNIQNRAIRDEQPSIYRLTPQKFKEFGSCPSFITVGIHINKFEKFDIVKNEFLIDGIIWFKFIPGSTSLSTLEGFSFDRGEIVKRSSADISLENEYIVAKYNIKVRFSSNLNYINFPIDNHRIYLMLSHEFVSPREIQFISSENFISIDPTATQTGWNMFNKNVITGYNEAQFEDDNEGEKRIYPISLFSFDFERSGSRQLLTIILPLLLSFYLGLFSLSTASGSWRIGIVAVTAIVSYRFVIDRISPNVGYFMISDYLFFLFLIASLVPFITSIATSYNKEITPLMLKIALGVTHGTIIVISWIILHS
jgi:hypothetical protein